MIIPIKSISKPIVKSMHMNIFWCSQNSSISRASNRVKSPRYIKNKALCKICVFQPHAEAEAERCRLLPTISFSRPNLVGGSEGVGASNRLSGDRGADGNAGAVGVTTGGGNTSRDPDAVGTGDAAGAGDQAGAVESKVTVLVDDPALGLGVAAGEVPTGLGGVLQDALAHTGAVGVELLGDVAGRVEVQLAVLQEEGGVLLVRAVEAGGALLLDVQGEAALHGGEGGVLQVRSGADGEHVEGGSVGDGAVALADAKGGGGGGRGGKGGGGEDLELHFDGWFGWLVC